MTKKKAAKKRSAAKTPTERRARRKPVKSKVTKATTPLSPLQAHFEQAGIMFDQSNSKILRKLDRLMGTERCEAWKSFSYRRHHGVEIKGTEYDFFQNAAELNTLFSLQSHVSLRVCEWISQHVASCITNGQRICDLGCGGGILAGWLAQQYPQCEVVGCDSLSHLIAAAAETQQALNLALITWDYANSPYPFRSRCDILVSCFGIDFPPLKDDLHPLDAATLRAGPFYDSRKQLMKSFFRNWRSAINDDGKLFGVFRIPSDSCFLAALDAAHEEGWEFEPALSTKLSVGAEYFPAMTFSARWAQVLPEDEVLWQWVGAAASDPKETYATEAICLYRSLVGKKVIREESKVWDIIGITFHAVVGTANSTGFEFTHGTSGFARLKLIALDAVETAQPWFLPEELQFDLDGFF